MFETLFGCVRRATESSQINRYLKDIERQNFIERDVYEYDDAPVEAFVTKGQSENVMASGNSKQIRDRVCCAAAYNANEAGEAVIVLHAGNSELETLLADAFVGYGGFRLINASNPIYDPFLRMDKHQIAQFVLSSTTEACNIMHIGSGYIKGLTDYLAALSQPTCVKAFKTCPFDTMISKVEDLKRAGTISSTTAYSISEQLNNGLVERGNIEHYFNELNYQAGMILASNATVSSGNATNIKQTVNNNQVIVFDINPFSSDLLMNVLIQELKNCMSEGKKFTLVLDSISASASDALTRLLKTFSPRCKLVFSAKDVYAELAGIENMFSILMGKANSLFISQHDNAGSSEKMSEQLGKYEKSEINNTISTGDTYSTYGQVLPGSSSSNIYSVHQVVKPRVEEREITSLRQDELFIKKEARTEVIKVRSTYGNARGVYSEPARRTPSSVASGGFNLVLLIFLLIFVPPIGLFYGYFYSGKKGKIIYGSILITFFITVFILMIYACFG